MALSAGTRLGPYEVVAALGAGGMGEVFRARDPRLGRDVAIKALPEGFARDAERLARFEREAKLLASLSHPNIAGILGLEDVGGERYLVLEFVDGETLAARLARGPLPLDEALDIGRQIATGIEAAHESGVVHRDLKPGNVMLAASGVVKVLDFGLAKAGTGEASTSSVNLSASPTMTYAATQAGVILGTAAYMSPEQARGKAVDRRTDIWSFGCVLYECLAGRQAFEGETVSDLVARILEREPDWSALPAALSPRLRRLLERCLVKDPRRRLQAIGEARIAFEDLAHGREEAPGGGITPSRRRRAAVIPWLVATAALVGLAASLRRPPGGPPEVEMSVVPAGGARVGEDLSYHPMAISPDGRAIAYTTQVRGALKLRLRRLDTREDVEIPGTDRARNPFFSPDGQWIGFFDSRHMLKVSARGGTPVELAESLQDRLGTWLADGTIVYSREVTAPLYRIPETGGSPVAITTLDSTRRERTHRFPCALAGGPWVVFTVQTVDSPGGYDDASIDAVSVKTGERRHLFKGARRAVWAPGGYLLLARGSDLYATPIDPRNPRVTQDPVPVLSGVTGEASAGSSCFSIANDGTLAWIPGGESENAREIGWFDRSGRWTPTSVAPGPNLKLTLSSDGTRALVTAGPGGGSSDLWLADLRTGGMSQLTQGGRSGPGIWLPGEGRIAYSKGLPEGGEAVIVRRLDGAGGEREVFHSPNPVVVTDVTRDGKWLITSDYGLKKGRIRLVPVEGNERVHELAAEGDGYEIGGMVSPDGRWLAYVSNKTGREEVCVRRLYGSGGSWQVSTTRATYAAAVRWGREGRELFFISQESLMRVATDLRGQEFAFGAPEELFEVPPSSYEVSFGDYDCDRVTNRFLFTRPPKGVAERREIAVSLGWAKRLRDRLRGRPPRS